MKLYLALGISSGDVVAFAGAGGKSGAILNSAHELAGEGMRVIIAPTTKMFHSEIEAVGTLAVSEDPEELLEKTEKALRGSSVVVAGSAMISKNRIGGVDPEAISSLSALADIVLVEADGSRRRPIKGTADHEPLLPGSATLVVAVANIQALGRSVDEDNVHRPVLFSKLTGIGSGQSITPRAFARSLAQGSLRNVPSGTRAVALITGVEPGRTMVDAAIVTREMWTLGVKNVVLSSITRDPPDQVWMP